jgi:hypothetical protein
MAECACCYFSFSTPHRSHNEEQLVQNGKTRNLMKIRGFKLRTGALLDTHITTLQSLRVRNMSLP